MRLVCPNCEAKYEVPDDAIPDTGRDVQCANCGHAWFQVRARSAASVIPAATPVVEEPAAEPTPPEPPVAAPAAPEPDVVVEAVAEPATFPEAAAEPVAVTPPGPETDPDLLPEPEAVLEAEREASAYAVDDTVLSILREEAQREASARRAEALGLETQTDLGLEAALAAAPETDAKPAPRRDLLPDVEEINSTLRPSEAEGEEWTDAQAFAASQRRPGFRGGFLTVMVVAILGAAVYLAAPQISGMVPSVAAPLEAYVTYVDGLRLALDGLMRSATVAINGS